MRQDAFHFDGPDVTAKDTARLTGQLLRIFNLMHDRRWRTYEEIAAVTKDPITSISAQLRHLRKPRFGKHTVERRRRDGGLWEYRLLPRQKGLG